jgi:hypothetical protein
MHRTFSVAATSVVLSVFLAAPVMAADPTGSPPPSSAPRTVDAASVTPAPTSPSLDPSAWVTYTSEQYGYGVGYPPDWTVRSAERDWTFEADAADRASPAMERFIAPDGSVGVSAWSVPLAPGTAVGDRPGLEAWVETYCAETGNAPCSGIHERAVPLCLERRDCHPGVMVPFDDDVQAFFTAGIYDADKMNVVAVWSGESQPGVAPYGGAQRLLEAFLSTMSVWPESVPFEERVVRAVPTPSPS